MSSTFSQRIPVSKRLKGRASPLPLLALCLLLLLPALQGCGVLAAGTVVGAGAMAYRGYESREFHASLEEVAEASRQGVRSLGLYVLSEDRGAEDDGSSRLTLRSEFTDTTPFRITLRQKPEGVILAEVWVGRIGDPERSRQVLDAISAQFDARRQ